MVLRSDVGHPLFSILLCHRCACQCYREPQTGSQETSLEAGMDYRAVSHCSELAQVHVGVLVLVLVGLLEDAEFVHSASTD